MGSKLFAPRTNKISNRTGLSASKRCSLAVENAVQMLEKRLLFTGSVLADWTFETSQPATTTGTTAGPFAADSGSEASIAGTAAASARHASSSGFSSPGGNAPTSGHSFSSNTWTVGDYYQFTVSTTGQTLTSISYDQEGSNTGPKNFALQYAVNGGTTYTQLATNTVNSASSFNTTTFNLSSTTAVDNQTSVTFRVVDTSTTAVNYTTTVQPAGTDRIDNVIISAQNPGIYSVFPAAGSTSAGSTVTITGAGFTGYTGVNFGSTAATVLSSSDTQLVVTSPGGSAGTVDLSVLSPNGTSDINANDQYTFTNSPVVFGITPTLGSYAGGTTVTITGANFTSTSTVQFGTVAATGVTFNPANGSLTAVSPSTTNTTNTQVDVLVTNGSTTSTPVTADKFTYIAVPTATAISGITGITANTLLDGGGQVATITGTNFVAGTTVMFGTKAGTSVTVVSATSLTVVTPAQAATTAVSITVTTPGGSATVPGTFTYILTTIAAYEAVASGTKVTLDDNPTISEVLDIQGDSVSFAHSNNYTSTAFLVTDPTGSTEIYGLPTSNAFQTDGVTAYVTPTAGDVFASISGTSSPYANAPEIGSVTGLLQSGTTTTPSPVLSTITAVTASTTLTAPLAGAFTEIKGVDITFPSSPSTFYGTTLSGTITDTAGKTMVFYYSSGAEATVNPAKLGGNVLPGVGDSSIPYNKLVDVYGYVNYFSPSSEFNVVSIVNPSTANPVVTAVSPTTGTTTGGTTVTVSGYGFLDGVTAVNFVSGSASSPGTSINVLSDTSLTVVSPASPITTPSTGVGTVDVEVVDGNGTSAAVTADHFGYTLFPAISNITPTFGPIAGGTTVTINGGNFTSTSTVKFGTLAATSVSYQNPNQIIAVSPAEGVGAVDVIVTAGGNPSATGSFDKFTYETTPAFATTALSPASGPDTGTTTVTITGTGFTGVTNVLFGTTAATSFTFVSDTKITAVSPSGTNGAVVDVRVINGIGESAVSQPYDQFTYTGVTVAIAEALPSGTIATLESAPVITAILSDPDFGGGTTDGVSYSKWSFLVQDASGSMDIYGTLPNGYVPVVGNAISVTGTVAPSNQIPELGTITAISTLSTGNSIASYGPIASTVTTVNVGTLPLGTGFGGHLVTLTGTIGGIPTFTTSIATGTFTDSSGTGGASASMTLFYWPTSYSMDTEQFAGMTAPTGSVTLTGFVDVYTSGSTVIPEFVPLFLPNPTWLSGTPGQAVWAPQSSTLYVNGAATITADPGSAAPFVIGDEITSPVPSPSALSISPTSATPIHLGGINLSGGASITVTTQSTPIVVQVAATSGFALDATSKINVTDNVLDIAGGNVGVLNALVAAGFDNGLWDLPGIVSSTAGTAGNTLTSVGVTPNTADGSTAIYTTFDGATGLAYTDVLVGYTNFGNTNMSPYVAGTTPDPAVDGTDYARIDSEYLLDNPGGVPASSPQAIGWFNGDFNYDGYVNGSDYTLIDNAFNRQGHGAVPSAIIAKPAAAYAVAPLATADASVFSDKKVKESLADQVDDLITN